MSDEMQRFILSYPKSGRTWLRLYITIYFMLLEEEMPTVLCSHSEAQIEQLRDPERRVKRILLVRNPYDVLVSFYFQETVSARRDKRGIRSISEFIRHPKVGIRPLLKAVNQWKEYEDQLVINYEDLFKPIWEEIFTYFEFPIDKQIMRDTDKICSFDNVRENLRAFKRLPEGWRYLAVEKGQATAIPKNPEAHKLRRGKVGGYVDYLSGNDINYIKEVMYDDTEENDESKKSYESQA
jgi:hypothetical protein